MGRQRAVVGFSFFGKWAICVFLASACTVSFASILYPADTPQETHEFAGEFFGQRVPLSNYYVVRNAVVIFGIRGAQRPKTEQEIENATWEQLLLSFIAYNEKIEVSRKEIVEEISKMLAAESVTFDWQKDASAYQAWVKDKTREPVELFEDQVKHLLQVEKLKGVIRERLDPAVSRKRHENVTCLKTAFCICSLRSSIGNRMPKTSFADGGKTYVLGCAAKKISEAIQGFGARFSGVSR